MSSENKGSEAYLKQQIEQAYSCAAEIIAEKDRLELFGIDDLDGETRGSCGEGKSHFDGESKEGVNHSNEPGSSEASDNSTCSEHISETYALMALHRKLVLRLHPYLGPSDRGVCWQYRLVKLALKRRDLPMMRSLNALTQHLDSWNPLEGMGKEELAAELMLANALVVVERQQLDVLKGDDWRAA